MTTSADSGAATLRLAAGHRLVAGSLHQTGNAGVEMGRMLGYTVGARVAVDAFWLIIDLGKYRDLASVSEARRKERKARRDASRGLGNRWVSMTGWERGQWYCALVAQRVLSSAVVLGVGWSILRASEALGAPDRAKAWCETAYCPTAREAASAWFQTDEGRKRLGDVTGGLLWWSSLASSLGHGTQGVSQLMFVREVQDAACSAVACLAREIETDEARVAADDEQDDADSDQSLAHIVRRGLGRQVARGSVGRNLLLAAGALGAGVYLLHVSAWLHRKYA